MHRTSRFLGRTLAVAGLLLIGLAIVLFLLGR